VTSSASSAVNTVGRALYERLLDEARAVVAAQIWDVHEDERHQLDVYDLRPAAPLFATG
jgi:hypothetical protein